jgi:hypothetical protein
LEVVIRVRIIRGEEPETATSGKVLANESRAAGTVATAVDHSRLVQLNILL